MFPAGPLLMRVLCVVLTLTSSLAAADDYLTELVAAASARSLHLDPQWQALLHYKARAGLFGLRSLADDSRFFNAPDGKTNPQAELAATLAAFFSTDAETAEQQNPQCRFMARYQWLKATLSFDANRLPEQPCARFHAWREKLDPERITLVFASAYLNNPSSAYGHTLLRVDRVGQADNTSLLAYAISYAARADDTNALLFGLKGLFGGYNGTYAMSPYYQKVAEYNDFENRDLWEYELALTPAEIERILAHVWELGPINFDYFFFDENCAYQLLLLLDVARPSLALADEFPLWAIPADTIRAVAQIPGLVRRTVFRPSRSTVLKTRIAGMDAGQIERALALARIGTPPDPPIMASVPAAELDLAYDYLDYRRERGDLQGPEVAQRLRALLSARSKLDEPGELSIPTPAVRPEQGHRSGRIGLTLGRLEGHAFQELRLRPAYHDLLDAQAGFLAGSQIDFFNVVLRHANDSGQVALERFDIAHVVSLSLRDSLLKPTAWSAYFGADRLRKGDGTEGMRGRITVMGGQAHGLTNCCQWHLLAGGDIQGSKRLEDGYAAGGGAKAGVQVDLSAAWRVAAGVRYFHYFLGEEHTAREARLEARLTLSTDWALRFEAAEQRELGARSTTVSATLYRHF